MKIAATLALALAVASTTAAQQGPRFESTLLLDGQTIELLHGDCQTRGLITYTSIGGSLVLYVETIDCREKLFADGFEGIGTAR